MEGSLSFPPGFRFHPTDEELITYYLTRKVSNYNFVGRAIVDVDLNKCEPWDLPAKASMGEKEWYFFSLKDRKYPTGLRTNRATEAGYWKTTGKDKEIHHSGRVVGMKKTLVFYKGRAPKGEKSNWVMHEYRLQTKFSYKPTKEEWVVCRVFQKSSTAKSSSYSPSALPTIESCLETNLMNELGEIDMANLSSLVGSSSSLSTISPNNDDEHMNVNVNWGLTNFQSLVCPLSMLNSKFSPMNSSILRAMQLNSSHQSEAMDTSINPFAAQVECFGTNLSTNLSSYGTKNMDCAAQQEQESIW
ncbi:hypothetical protein AAC387_Pa10g1450 [Persea americana]